MSGRMSDGMDGWQRRTHTHTLMAVMIGPALCLGMDGCNECSLNGDSLGLRGNKRIPPLARAIVRESINEAHFLGSLNLRGTDSAYTRFGMNRMMPPIKTFFELLCSSLIHEIDNVS